MDSSVEAVVGALAIGLLGFFTVGYFVVVGAGLGLGMLLPWLAHDPRERRQVLAASARGGAAWLVAAAGVLLTCLPQMAGELLRERCPALLVLLLGLAVRRAGLLRANQASVYGCWLTVLGWSWLLASLLTGRTTGATGTTAAGTVAVVALAVALLFALHGLGFGTLRLTGRPFERARLLAGRGSSRELYALTAVAMVALPLVCGLQLPLWDAAVDGPVGGSPTWLAWLPWVVVPLLAAVAALLTVARTQARRTFPDTLRPAFRSALRGTRRGGPRGGTGGGAP
ncbi:cytochrome d ubiquinol oxidase subunit II [Streptomyces sp. NA04227]|uniref:cytochrome d ubiquinol oxidase subunit II n=1 Tax=Streptomyces sp. NA04227 TaxID=2742136 RepID=UPI0015910CA1|nr:cytochrome d ubiquinol oxidase subunit II [Streptomyces sp. NA04227]QKW08072.1 cytochrome d ubiquinol oxidase subunit II [Streptomyces sp. NA04227]